MTKYTVMATRQERINKAWMILEKENAQPDDVPKLSFDKLISMTDEEYQAFKSENKGKYTGNDDNLFARVDRARAIMLLKGVDNVDDLSEEYKTEMEDIKSAFENDYSQFTDAGIKNNTGTYDPESLTGEVDYNPGGTILDDEVDDVNQELTRKQTLEAQNAADAIDTSTIKPTAGEEVKRGMEKAQQNVVDEGVTDSANSVGQIAGVGNIIGMMAGGLNSTAQLAIALMNRPTPETNTFLDYANDTLKIIDTTKRFAGQVKSLQERDLSMAERGQRAINRAGARGINTLRALDLGTHLMSLGEQRNITQDYYNRMEKLYGKEADTMLDRDKTVMSAEERKLDKETANRDNYLSGLSSAFAQIGETGQNMGKQMNTTEETQMAMQIAGNSGKWGDFTDYATKFLPDYYKQEIPE